MPHSDSHPDSSVLGTHLIDKPYIAFKPRNGGYEINMFEFGQAREDLETICRKADEEGARLYMNVFNRRRLEALLRELGFDNLYGTGVYRRRPRRRK